MIIVKTCYNGVCSCHFTTIEKGVYEMGVNIEELKNEALDRLKTLIDQGLQTDIDIISLFKEGQLCISEPIKLMGILGGIIMPLEDRPIYKKALDEFNRIHSGSMPYFIIVSKTIFGTLVSVFFVSEEESDWDYEREILNDKYACVYTYNMDDDTDEVGEISYEIMMGGPIRVL